MDYSVFLQYLNDHIDTSGKNGRHIIRFSNRRQFLDCIQELYKLKGKYTALKNIRIISLLQALVCPLTKAAMLSSEKGSFKIEKDARIKEITTSNGKEPKPNIPWGVKRIGAPAMWSRSTGYGVRIGVIDTGIDYNHPDLKNSVAKGVNIINPASLPYDDNGHGTHIAGTIAAAGGIQGMIGVAPRAMIYPVKSFSYDGSAYVSDIILGIDWCIRNKMHVINMSFGMKSRSSALQSIIKKAYSENIVVVASAGNDKKNRTVDYPARYHQTISVGATGRNGKIASFSNRGPHIDLYAPGERVHSSWLGGGYREMSGTSMATSHVSGTIALLLSLKPGLKPDEIKRRLRRASRPIGHNNKTKTSIGEVCATRIFKVPK